MSNPNVRQTSTSPLKFYAPVQIVAPTLYLNSGDKNQNNIVIQLHDENGKLQMNPEIKQNRGDQSSAYRVGKAMGMKSRLVDRQSPLGYSSREIEPSNKFI